MTDNSSGNYHLEFAQRDLLGLISERMEFSEATIASALNEIIAEQDDLGTRLFLKAIARALSGEDDVWRLKLIKTTRGRFVPSDEHDQMFYRHKAIAAWVKEIEADGTKRESAVHSAMAHFAVSRQTVFNALKKIDEFEETMRILDLGFGRVKGSKP